MSNPEKKPQPKPETASEAPRDDSANKKETKPEPAPSKASLVVDSMQSIPVAFVRFGRPFQVPGRQVDEAMKAETHANGRSWSLEYIPQIRHHKITFVDPHRDGGVAKIAFIHETHVLAWEPAL